MTPARLALWLAPALPLAPILLVLSACGDEGSGASEGRKGPSAPLGFELAMAGVSEGAADDSAVPAPAAPAPLIALTPEELAARLAKGNVRLIDVRTTAEVAEGVIPAPSISRSTSSIPPRSTCRMGARSCSIAARAAVRRWRVRNWPQ